MRFPVNRIIRWSMRFRRDYAMTVFCATQGLCISFVGTQTDASVYMKATLIIAWSSCVVVCSRFYHAYRYWLGSADHWRQETEQWIFISDRWRKIAERNHTINEFNHLMYFTPPYDESEGRK